MKSMVEPNQRKRDESNFSRQSARNKGKIDWMEEQLELQSNATNNYF